LRDQSLHGTSNSQRDILTHFLLLQIAYFMSKYMI